jgi:hypothetical protein
LGGRRRTGASDPGALSKSHLSGVRRLQRGAADLPEFCDFDCPHATFSPPDASGACRRDQAVWCTLTSRYNNKNARCLAGPRKAHVRGSGKYP